MDLIKKIGTKNLIIGAAVLVVVVYVATRSLRQAAASVTQAGVNVATGAAEGVVVGVSEVIGIPDTDAAKCSAAIATGDYWDASVYCDAGTFLKFLAS